jgi:hypothetical protein
MKTPGALHYRYRFIGNFGDNGYGNGFENDDVTVTAMQR